MNIALHLDCPPGEPTGIGRYMNELARALALRGNGVEGWTRLSWRGSAAAAFMDSGIPVKPLFSAGGFTDPLMPGLYGRAGNIEVIHCPNGDLLPATGGIPQTVMVHDLAMFRFDNIKPEAETRLWKSKIEESVRKAAGILVNSRTTGEDLKNFFPESSSRIFLTSLGIDHLKRIPRVSRNNGSHILAVGTVEPRKNYSALFRGYATLAGELPDIPPLVVAGGMGYRSEEITAAAGRGVRFEGYVSEERLRELYSTACCLVHPAIYEGFGFTVPEALGFGLPVVSSNTGSLKELFSGAVYPVDPDDPESIGYGIRQALEKGLTPDQKEAAEELFRTLTWDSCAEKTEEAFRAVTK